MKSLAAGLLASFALPVGAACPELLDHRANSLQGQAQDLCQYAGQVVLMVNTASYCGYTHQLVGRKGDRVASFPSKVAPDDPKLQAALEGALAARR